MILFLVEHSYGLQGFLFSSLVENGIDDSTEHVYSLFAHLYSCNQFCVYILLHAFVTPGLNIHLSSTECYTGSTIHTLHDRQNTRQRKLRQLQRTQLVS